MTLDPLAFYDTEAASASAALARGERLMRRVSLARLASIGLAIATASAALGLSAADARWPWWTATAIAAATFIVLIFFHGRIQRRHAAARARRHACEAGRARLERNWDAAPAIRWTPPLVGRHVALAHDVDVTGDVSLLRLLDVCNPALGTARVLDWLLADPATVGEIADRAASVDALRADPQALLEFAAAGRGHRRVPPRGIEHFATWSALGPSPADARWAGALSVLSAALTVSLVASLAAGGDAARATAPLILIGQLVCSAAARRRLSRDLAGVDDALTQLDPMIHSLRLVTTMRVVPGRFGAVQRRLREQYALTAACALRRLLDWNAVRYSPLGHWALNATVGLDVLVWAGVVRWRGRHATSAHGWIDAVADAEALVALATLAFDNPDWTRPVVHERSDVAAFDAAQLGHPLIAPSAVVPNDLRLDAAGDVVVVSGSNMAGKTTLLRAAGLNALLALAGGPACAKELSIRRCRVRTSVRVEDDPSHGVSLFLAEVTRLQSIVREAEDRLQPPVFFLLDEILHGTNADDRREAIRLILRRLGSAPAFGLVTTHDPGIARGVRARDGAGGVDARQLHFRETVSGDDGSVRMTFDYLARPGPATTRNAMAILRMLGLS